MPEEQIVPVGEELFAAVKVVAEQILKENQADNTATTQETDLENFSITTENPVNFALTVSRVQLGLTVQLFYTMVYVLCFRS